MVTVEMVLELARRTQGWSDEDVNRERSARKAALEQLTCEGITHAQLTALSDDQPFDVEKFWTGMGGAAGESGSPRVEPGQEITVYDEIIDKHEVSVSRSDGVGPMVDPATAVHEINDPEVKQRWWPPKVDPDPKPSPSPPPQPNLRKST